MTCVNKEILIIGGGLGGLFTGALLAKNDFKVTVLEKNTIIGGGLQCFWRHGKLYETGMHIMGGFTENGSLNKICSYLGIMQHLQIEHLPEECMDIVRFESEDKEYYLASGREGFTQSLITYFPDEAEGIKAYINKIYELSDKLPLFNMRERTDYIVTPPDEYTLPADLLIERYVKNPHLRALLAYLNPLYNGVAGSTPAFVHAVINTLYINGESRFIGGSQQLADALAGVIEKNGGKVLNNKPVIAITTEEGKISGVYTADSKLYTADYYISSIHPDYLLQLLPSDTFRKSFVERLQSIPDSCSAFSLYIDLKPESFPYLRSTNYCIDSSDSVWGQEEINRNGEIKGFMYMTPPEPGQGEWASRILVYSLMKFDEVKRWENTRSGHRGEDYEEWKNSYKSYLIERLEKLYPGFKDNILHTYSASPLTVRDFYNTKNGSIFGYRKEADNLSISHIPAVTKIPNLLLTGQNIGLHGICGVPLNALITAEEILGKNFLVNEINRNFNSQENNVISND